MGRTTLVLLLGTCIGYPPQRPPSFKLALCNQSIATSEVLSTARQTVDRIFNRAGVTVSWLELDRPKCVVPEGSERFFIVLILPKAPNGWTSPDAMGLAPHPDGAYPRAYVFYNFAQITVNLLERKDLRSFASGIVLGHAIAHEVGHLLIPENAHSMRGIMAPTWDYTRWEDMLAGRLIFDEKQAGLLRRSLENRKLDETNLKSEIRNMKSDGRAGVQYEISDFGFEMQDSSNF